MTSDIKFGTDGWRGAIAEDYTFDNVRRCAQAFAQYLIDQGQTQPGVVIGYDCRFNSEHFAAAAAEVVAGNGIKVFLTDKATPTPVISFAVLSRRAVGAINITASHNPPTDNGFKVRSSRGAALAPEELVQVEARIPPSVDQVKRLKKAQAIEQGLIEVFDPKPAYLVYLRQHIDVEPIKAAGLKVIHDAMWGAGAGWFSEILAGGQTQVIPIHSERNPIFPEMSRPEPIPPNVDPLLHAVVVRQADAGVATDGDSDRIGIVDEQGGFVNQLQVYALLALYLLDVRGERGPIVKTLSTTSMLEKLGRLYNVPVYETGVGFKYVGPKMLETDAMIGGEESGGFAFRGLPERDGILAGLFILDFMVKTGLKLTQLIDYLYSRVGPHYYDRIDVRFDQAQRDALRQALKMAKPATLGGLRVTGIDTRDGFKYNLEDGGWMLIRFSGTEPLVRVYTETTRAENVQPILKSGLALAGLE